MPYLLGLTLFMAIFMTLLKALGWADGPSLYDFYGIMHNIDPHTLMHGEFLQTWR